MAITIATSAQRSWAQMVAGDSKKAENPQKSLKPGARGSLLRFCRGKVLSMLSHYGWLMVFADIDDPAVEKHGGDVYIHKDDVVDGETLCPGDIVTFYLYVDEQGLGAEECHVEQRAASLLNPDATEFKPMVVNEGSSLRASAEVFVPGVALSKPSVYGIGDQVSDVFLRLSHVFASDDEDDDDDDEPYLAMSWKAKRAPSSDGSTSDGGTSDSEDDTSMIASSDSEEESSPQTLREIAKMLPPGWTLPPNFRPPPGLSLPTEFAENLNV